MRSKAFLFSSMVLCASNAPANAISWNTQMNCASDYYAYCSIHTAGSAGCHACMRANRVKLSNSCVSALIDDGVLTKANTAPRNANVTPRKAKIALVVPKAKAPSRAPARSVANPPSADAAVVRPKPKTEPSVAAAAPATRPEPLERAPEPPATPPMEPVEAAPAIDQQTFEALKNRAPYFVPMEDIASRFARAEENVPSQPSPR